MVRSKSDPQHAGYKALARDHMLPDTRGTGMAVPRGGCQEASWRGP